MCSQSGSATALVTGASSGIGRAVAERLLREGHSVLGVARSFPTGSCPDGMLPVILDLSDLDRLPAALGRLLSAHPDIAVVVSNAGRGRFGSLEEFSYRQIRSLLELNFLSHAFLVRAILPAMKRRGGGHVVFTGSEAALHGSRYGALYCASKFALRGFAQALREETASAGIAVTVVNPGMVRSRFFDDLDFEPGDSPRNALAPEEVAAAVWLAVSRPDGSVVDEINLSPASRVVRKKR